MAGRGVRRAVVLAVLPLLAACGGGGGGGVASTPAPTPAPPPAPAPAPAPSGYDTAEYRRSNGAAQANAIAAYTAGATGAGVVAGVIDSGVNTASPEFAGRISNLSADLAGSRGLLDEDGHGSAVADVLLGAKNDNGIHGVAYNATLLVLRTDTPGTCAAAAKTATEDDGCTHNDNAIARGVDLAVTARARVVNISLGGAPANPALRAAIDRATTAGVIIVISAGNDYDADPALGANPDLLAQIAIDPVAHGLVLIAGAVDANHTSASFSDKAGNSANFYVNALGVGIRSIDNKDVAYIYDGTSLSAPVVSGAVALLAQAFPSLTPAQIVDLLLRTATDLGAPGTDPIYGRGELNLERAFAPQGATSLTKSAVAVSLADNGALSPAMGDAVQGGTAHGTKSGLDASIRDGYGRGYTVDLSPTIRNAPRALRLVPALTGTVRSLAADQGSASFSLALGEDTLRRLALTPGEARVARALAGSVVTRLAPGTAVALGFSQGSGGLARSLDGSGGPAFLIAERADGGRGLGAAPRTAAAVRQQFGRLGVTVSAEAGEVRLWDLDDIARRGDRRSAYSLSAVSLDARRGILTVTAGASRLDEAATILGSRFGPALGGGGATTLFADAAFTLTPGAWRFGAALRQGWTRVAAGTVRDGSTLTTRALSFDAARGSLFARGDSVSLRWSEPLRVTAGALLLTGFDGPQRLGLAPRGHERTVEAGYGRPLGRGWLSGSAYLRRQPDNLAGSPDDVGLALRYGLAF